MNKTIVGFNEISQPFEDKTIAHINSTVSRDVILSDKVTNLVLLFFVIVGALISIIGIIANVINIIVFIKQGAYKEHGSVNLLGMAVSDLCVTITMLYTSCCYSLIFINPPNLPWEPFAFMFLTGAWPHLMFAQITRAITAYVAFERCICVVLPFKVKSLLTPKRSIGIIICIFFCFMCSFSPAFIKQQLIYKLDPLVNRTRIVLTLSPDWQQAVDIMWYINSIIFNVGSVAVVLICTLITASRVQLSKTWRDSASTGNAQRGAIEPKPGGAETAIAKSKTSKPEAPMSSSKMQKEKKLITMIISISVIFLFCYIPDLAFLLMYSINRDIRILGKYNNLALTMYSFTFFMETVNSSINIFVYYKMSSKYNKDFRELIGLVKGN